jgi:zinc transporter 2
LNIRAAIIHLLGDLIQSAGVIISAIIIMCNKDLIIFDPICTYVFSILVFATTVPVARDCFKVLMGCTPDDIDLDKIRSKILKNKCVQKVEDLHVWVLGDEKNVLTCHIKLHPACAKVESQIERVNE